MAVLREVYDVVIDDKSYWVVRIAIAILVAIILFLEFAPRFGVVIR
ncbi:MAG: hypothetical protein GXN93_04875 [Candidatus Diapherotrites archaeon]|nr:hypothetical protein [Candidatus Diapherotrites archaeon]